MENKIYSMREVLYYFSLKHNGDFRKIYNSLNLKEQVNERLFNQLKKNNKEKFITLIDKDYPEIFKFSTNPPIVLFYRGDLNLLNDKEMSEPINELTEATFPRIYNAAKKKSINGKEILEYVVACENHEHIDQAIENLTKQKIPLKNYKRKKDRER